MKITAEVFEVCTGSAPENDDLDRCNCERAGQLGHMGCGWCDTHKLPFFMHNHEPSCRLRPADTATADGSTEGRK